MSLGTLLPQARLEVYDLNGAPVSGALASFFLAGTSTPTPTYSDVGLTTPNSVPVVANAAGRFGAIYLSPGTSVKMVVTDAAGVGIYTQDNMAAAALTTAAVDLTGTAGEVLGALKAVYLSAGDGGKVAGQWYLADNTLAYSSSGAIAIGLTLAAISSGSSGTIRLQGQVAGLVSLTVGAPYFVGVAGALTITPPLNLRPVGIADSTSTLVLDADPGQALTANDVCDFRLTLLTGNPLPTTDFLAATTVYWSPYKGNRVALYNGSTWELVRALELSIAVPAVANQMYDVWVYNNAGVPTLELSAWASDVTRTTLPVAQDGVYCKTGALTRRYVGSFRTTAVAGQTEDSLAKRHLWNYYHRALRVLRVNETADTYTYATATMRQANANAANQLAVVVGIAEVAIQVETRVTWAHSAIGGFLITSIGEDSTTTTAVGTQISTTVTDAAGTFKVSQASLRKYPAIGYHVYPWLEQASGATATITGDNGAINTGPQSGISGVIEG